jgi:hypothetical protein
MNKNQCEEHKTWQLDLELNAWAKVDKATKETCAKELPKKKLNLKWSTKVIHQCP